MKEISAMGLRPHFIIMDKFTGYPLAHSGVNSDLSNAKKRISYSYRSEVQSNEDLWNALTMYGQMDSFMGKLHNIAKGYELACDEFIQLIPESVGTYHEIKRNLIGQLPTGIQYSLSNKLQSMENQMKWFPDLCNSKIFTDVYIDIIAFRDTSRDFIEKMPVAKRHYKWEKLNCIEILEITKLETKSL